MTRKKGKNGEGEWTSSFVGETKVSAELKKLTSSPGWVAATHKLVHSTKKSPNSSRASTPVSTVSSSSRHSGKVKASKNGKKSRGRPPGPKQKFRMVLEKDEDYEIDYVSPDEETTADESDADSKAENSDRLSDDELSFVDDDDVSSLGEVTTPLIDQYSDVEMDEDFPPLELPESSRDLLIPNNLLLPALGIYEIFRHFRNNLRLSPMLFEDFCAALMDNDTSILLTECYIAVLKALLREEDTAGVLFGPTDQNEQVRASLNFLDHMTWPEVVRSYLESYFLEQHDEAIRVLQDPKFPMVGVEDKITVLKTFTDIYLASNKIRDQLMTDGVIHYDDHCRVCHKLGDLLCCETCPAVYHLACCDPPLEEVPDDEWQCEVCVAHKLNGVFNCEPQHEFRGQYLRHEPIGTDRHGNKYWFLARRLIVESSDKVWYYSTQGEFERVISILDPDRYEMVLCEALKDVAEEFPKYSKITRDVTEEALPNERTKMYLDARTVRVKREIEEEKAKRREEEEKRKKEEEEKRKKEEDEAKRKKEEEEKRKKEEEGVKAENEVKESDLSDPPATNTPNGAVDSVKPPSEEPAIPEIQEGTTGVTGAGATVNSQVNATDSHADATVANDATNSSIKEESTKTDVAPVAPTKDATTTVSQEVKAETPVDTPTVASTALVAPAATNAVAQVAVTSVAPDPKPATAPVFVPSATVGKSVTGTLNPVAVSQTINAAPNVDIAPKVAPTPQKSFQVIKLGQGVQVKTGPTPVAPPSGGLSQLKTLFVLNKDGTKTPIMLGPAGKLLAPANKANTAMNRQILVLNSAKVPIPKMNRELKKLQFAGAGPKMFDAINVQNSPAQAPQVPASITPGQAIQTRKKIVTSTLLTPQLKKEEPEPPKEEKPLTHKEEAERYFRLGEDKAYKQYVNHYSENPLALNKYQHREERDRERHLGYKFSMTGEGEFKWIGDVLGSEESVIETLRSTLMHFEHQIPLCFMHTRWGKYRNAWGKIVMKCNTPQGFSAALGILEMATRSVVKKSVWKDSHGLTRMQRVTTLEKEEFDKRRKQRTRAEEEEGNRKGVWCKYPIPIKSTMTWKMRGEEYRMTAFGGWIWLSNTRHAQYRPYKPKPYVLVHKVESDEAKPDPAATDKPATSIPTEKRDSLVPTEMDTDSEKSSSTTSTATTKSADFAEDRLVHESLVREATTDSPMTSPSKDSVASQSDAVTSSPTTSTSNSTSKKSDSQTVQAKSEPIEVDVTSQSNGVSDITKTCQRIIDSSDVINVSENLLKRTPLYNKKWAASKVDILLGWRLMQRETDKKGNATAKAETKGVEPKAVTSATTTTATDPKASVTTTSEPKPAGVATDVNGAGPGVARATIVSDQSSVANEAKAPTSSDTTDTQEVDVETVENGPASGETKSKPDVAEPQNEAESVVEGSATDPTEVSDVTKEAEATSATKHRQPSPSSEVTSAPSDPPAPAVSQSEEMVDTSPEAKNTDAADKGSATATPDATDEGSATATPDATDNSGATTTPDVTDNSGATTTSDATDKSGATTTPDVTDNSGATTTSDVTDKSGAQITPNATDESGASTTAEATANEQEMEVDAGAATDATDAEVVDDHPTVPNGTSTASMASATNDATDSGASVDNATDKPDDASENVTVGKSDATASDTTLVNHVAEKCGGITDEQSSKIESGDTASKFNATNADNAPITNDATATDGEAMVKKDATKTDHGATAMEVTNSYEKAISEHKGTGEVDSSQDGTSLNNADATPPDATPCQEADMDTSNTNVTTKTSETVTDELSDSITDTTTITTTTQDQNVTMVETTTTITTITKTTTVNKTVVCSTNDSKSGCGTKTGCDMETGGGTDTDAMDIVTAEGVTDEHDAKSSGGIKTGSDTNLNSMSDAATVDATDEVTVDGVVASKKDDIRSGCGTVTKTGDGVENSQGIKQPVGATGAILAKPLDATATVTTSGGMSTPRRGTIMIPVPTSDRKPNTHGKSMTTTVESARYQVSRMSRVKKVVLQTPEGTTVSTTASSWKLQRYKKTSSAAKRENSMKLPLPWKFCADKKRRKSIFRLPPIILRKLALVGGQRPYHAGFNYGAKWFSGLEQFWMYPCPRPLFYLVWRYKLQNVHTLASVAHLLRIFWHAIRWDKMTLRPHTDDVVHTVTTDDEIITTELLKRKDNPVTGLHSEYYVRRITMPILDPEEEALRAIKPADNYTPSRRGLRSSTRPSSLRDRFRKDEPQVKNLWVPEEKVEMWQIRLFDQMLKQQRQQQLKGASGVSALTSNSLTSSIVSSPTVGFLPTLQNLKSPGMNVRKIPVQQTFLDRKPYNLMVKTNPQVQKIIVQPPNQNQQFPAYKTTGADLQAPVIRSTAAGTHYIVQGGKLLKPIIIKASSQIVATPSQQKTVHPTIKLNDGTIRFQQQPPPTLPTLKTQKISPRSPNQTQIKLSSSQLAQLMKVGVGTQVRVSVSLGTGRTGVGQIQLIPPGVQVTPSTGQQLMQTRVGGELKRFLFTLVSETTPTVSQSPSNEVTLQTASLSQRLQQMQRQSQSMYKRQNTDMKKLLTDKDPLWGSRPQTPDRAPIPRRDDRAKRKPISREQREEGQRQNVVMQVMKSILDRIERREDLEMRKKKREEALLKQKERKEQSEQAKVHNHQTLILNRHRDKLKQEILRRRAVVEKYLTHSAKNELREDQKKRRPTGDSGPVSKRPKKTFGNAIVTSAVLTENNSKRPVQSKPTNQQPTATKRRRTVSPPPPDNKKQKMISIQNKKTKDKKLYCVCKTPYDPTRFYIGCDLCLNWFHGSCVGIPESRAKSMNEWVCDDCKKVQEDPSQELYCLCRTPYDDSKFYIGCDICQDWYHGSCVGISEKEADSIDFYTCPRCSGKKGKPAAVDENKLTKDDFIGLGKIIKSLRVHKMAWPFLQPVSKLEVPNYYRIIKKPMDLGTVMQKLNSYTTLSELVGDVSLIFDNCRMFNGADSSLARCAEIVESVFVGKIREFRSKRGGRK